MCNSFICYKYILEIIFKWNLIKNYIAKCKIESHSDVNKNLLTCIFTYESFSENSRPGIVPQFILQMLSRYKT